MNRLDRMTDHIRERVPNLRLVNKSEVWWMRVLGIVLWPLVPNFMTDFTTVFGDTVYLPDDPARLEPDRLAITLAHEYVHQVDQQDNGLWFYLSYVLTPLPIWRTHRAHWERRGYAVDMMIAFERGQDEALNRKLLWLVDIFTGPNYAWMYGGRRAARDYLERTADQVRHNELQKTPLYAGILNAWRGE